MYNLIARVITVLTAPIWGPIAIYAALKMHWEDTVPSDEDLDYDPDPDYGKEKG